MNKRFKASKILSCIFYKAIDPMKLAQNGLFSQDMKNDDKILTTCLRLCHSSLKEEQTEGNYIS